MWPWGRIGGTASKCKVRTAPCRMLVREWETIREVQMEHPPQASKLQSKPIVGLIGGIGSGKSLVAEMFRRRGANVISRDQLGHEALRQPEIRAEVVGRWSPQVLESDGTISRRRLAAIVF